jgi:ATP-dependent DNA ligase
MYFSGIIPRRRSTSRAVRTCSAWFANGTWRGVVAKQASARYTPEATTWVKIKNRAYSQAVGRKDFFDRRRTAAK